MFFNGDLYYVIIKNSISLFDSCTVEIKTSNSFTVTAMLNGRPRFINFLSHSHQPLNRRLRVFFFIRISKLLSFIFCIRKHYTANNRDTLQFILHESNFLMHSVNIFEGRALFCCNYSTFTTLFASLFIEPFNNDENVETWMKF